MSAIGRTGRDSPPRKDRKVRPFELQETTMRVTFLIRERQLPGTAMHNAAAYDADYLKSIGHATALFIAPEGDRLPDLTLLESDLVIIEGAGWVPLDRINRLLTRGIRVIVRVHAAPEFLYYEFPGVSVSAYIERVKAAGALVGFVSPELADLWPGGVRLPICYPLPSAVPDVPLYGYGNPVHIGCFGAIRPLKNHTGQLLAVSEARNTWFKGTEFYFHVNSDRIEGAGHVLAELREIGRALSISIVGHSWLPPAEFRTDVIPQMTLGMFGSFAESFCLTAADFVAAGIPSVLGSHILWASPSYETTVSRLAWGIKYCLNAPKDIACAQWGDLSRQVALATRDWHNALTKVEHVLTH